ncbi:Wzz/FepE/Etk N-terminal domain-containing protein [Anaerovibrio slackiae]|uniref:Wzz/FepE/Etk N-terminal domain-containing protein n=1 Tax=Anaerovibrio slackiae TaxID=2652309 RepID=UPI0038700681
MNQEDIIDLGRLLSIIVDKKKVVISIIAVCTAIAAAVSCTLPKEYISQTTVQVMGIDMVISGKTTDSNIVSDMELLRSNEVLNPVWEQVFCDLEPENRPGIESFAKNYISVTNVKGTQLIKISAKGRTPQEAQYIAENVAQNFMELKNKAVEENKAMIGSVFDEKIQFAVKEADNATATLEKYVAEHGHSADTLEYKRLSREVDAKNVAYEALVVQAEKAKIQQSGNFIQVMDPANMPDENNPSGPKKKLLVAIGFVIGCLISLGYGLVLYKKKA